MADPRDDESINTGAVQRVTVSVVVVETPSTLTETV
jgi:hypothetical protein